MSERVVSVIRLPAPATRGVIEVEIPEAPRPGKWRIRLALWLMRRAGGLVRMRVRVLDA